MLILNMRMDPALAGRWYDRMGGRPPMVAGFALLAVSRVLLAIGVGHDSDPWLLPGLLVYGTGLAIVLTVNDPVSLDTVPDADQGQVSGVSATAEQGSGAIGIALLYALFHSAYVSRLYSNIDELGIPALDENTGPALKNALQAAEQTGLDPHGFDPTLTQYLLPADDASDFGYAVVILAVTVLSLIWVGRGGLAGTQTTTGAGRRRLRTTQGADPGFTPARVASRAGSSLGAITRSKIGAL